MPKRANKEKETILSEIWADVDGSYEEAQSKLRDALEDTSAFGSHDEYWSPSLEATFPDYVIVSKRENDKRKYMQANWTENTGGGIEFSDVKKVTATVAIKAVNESKAAILAAREMVDMSEVFITPISLVIDEEATTDPKNPVMVGRVAVAQKADTLNRNKRLYPKDVLREAVKDVQQKIVDFGPLPMDYKHRTSPSGQNERDLTQTVAGIGRVDWHEDDGTVSLEEIRMINTAAGKDLQAVLDGGLQLQVSQRAMGKSEILKNEEGIIFEQVNALKIDAWDCLAGGDASVVEADLEFTVISEAFDMKDKKVLTEDEFEDRLTQKITDLESGVADKVIEKMKEAGLVAPPAEETPAEEIPAEEESEEAVEEETPAEETPAEESPAAIATITESAPSPAIVKKLDAQAARIEELTSGMNEMAGSAKLATIKNERAGIATAIFSDERYSHFGDDEKKLLEISITDESLAGVVADPGDMEAFTEKYGILLGVEADKMDKILAITELRTTGFPKAGSGSGVTHVEVLSEGRAWMKGYNDLFEASMVQMNRTLGTREYRAPDDAPGIRQLEESILPAFDAQHAALLNEAGEEVTQLDIGPRVALIARAVIDAAFRTLTALGVYNIGSQVARIEDVPVKSWLPAEDSDIIAYMNAVHVAEDGTYPMAGVTYANYPIYAIKKAIRTQITPEAIATTKGTPMSALADAVSGLAIDIRNRMDLELWYLILAKGFEQNLTEISAYKAATDLGANVFQITTDGTTALTTSMAVVPFEWYKVVDANGNPTTAQINALFAIPTASTYQALDVREAGGDNTALVYSDDYAIDWNTGKLTLTDAGNTKEANNGLEVKFSYTENINQWSMTPDAGVQLFDHLINLRQAIGESLVDISNRHYNPTLIGMNLNTEVLITSGPQFTAAGSRASDAINVLNQVISMLGLNTIRTSALPQDWMPIMETDAGFYRTQTPWSIRGPITSGTTGNDIYLAEEFSGNDVPVSDKISLVGIQDLTTPWTSE